MNRLRQRKLDARENRQASLHSQGMTVEKTIVKLPQPKALVKKEKVLVESVKNVEVKRGRGRPPKASYVNTKEISKAQVVGYKKTMKGKEKK